MNLEIWNDKKKLEEVKKIASTYGVKLTSTLLLTISILITSASSESLNESDAKKTESDDLDYGIEQIVLQKSVEKDVLNLTATEENTTLTQEEKIEKILHKFNLTEEELDVCCAIAIAEACGEGMDYEEATHVINTAYNRIISARWVASLGDNLYVQMTAPDQFVVYQNGSYAKYLGQTLLPGYQAVIDFLSNTSEVEAHDYLSFRSNDSVVEGSIQLVVGGNRYFNLLTEEDRLEDFRIQVEGIHLTYQKY